MNRLELNLALTELLEPVITIWVIYDHPTDFPDHFVVRQWHVLGGITTPAADLNCWQAFTLEEARRFIPAGLTNIGRLPEDDPAILEAWI